MSWVWLAWLRSGHEPGGERLPPSAAEPLARASLTALDGDDLGALVAWPAGRKPRPDAVRADAAVIDPAGAPGRISLVLIPAADAPLFDDPAVSQALRAVLAGPAADAVSTFVRDSTHFAGAVTVRRHDVGRLPDDPFARLGRPVVAQVGAGLFGRTPPPPGPVIQRYAGLPWPAAGFPR